MMFSLAGTIDHIAPRLPPALVTPDALRRVRRLATSFPAPLTSWFDLECRLQSDRPQVDISIRVDRRRRDQLARYCAERQAHAGTPAWRRVAAFARAWADGEGPVARDVSAMWLEFDLDDDASEASPRFFVDFERRPPPHGHRLHVLQSVRALKSMRRALDPMFGGAVPDWVTDGVCWCLRNLPSSTELRYVGLPGGERVSAVRLCLLGSIERVPGILHVDLDDRGRIGSRLGLEYPFSRRPQVKGVVAETAFLDGLVARGGCAPEKREALLAWPGCEMAVLPHTIWPSLELRRVSHVKIVYDRNRAPEAKAYLCVAHAWRRRLAPAVRRPLLFAPAPIAS